ncbi:hypothetical protein FACS189491_02270 [Spirochaetia bacterium]|nr:hypothetical protein FACS189491_02270 [Spirochaetia bacterium]
MNCAKCGAPTKAASPAVPPSKAESPADAYVLPVPKGVVKVSRSMIKLPADFKGHLVIPEGVQIIGGEKYPDIDEAVTELTLPASLRKIEPGAFDNAVKLQKITIGANVELMKGQPHPGWALPHFFQKAYKNTYGSAAGTYLGTDFMFIEKLEALGACGAMGALHWEPAGEGADRVLCVLRG